MSETEDIKKRKKYLTKKVSVPRHIPLPEDEGKLAELRKLFLSKRTGYLPPEERPDTDNMWRSPFCNAHDEKALEEVMIRRPWFEDTMRMTYEGYARGASAKVVGHNASTINRNWVKATLPLTKGKFLVNSVTREKNVVNPFVSQITEEEKEERDKIRLDQLSRIRKGLAHSMDDLDGPEHILKEFTADAAAELRIQADKEEDEVISAIAEAQASPADQYQHYVAAQGIKLLRNSIKDLRAPKTVREFAELDTIIRRSLGLNAKGGDRSKMKIDISILNNGLTDKGRGHTKAMRADTFQTIDAEEVDKKDD